ncbi:MAG: RES family NAD+ phosphorylase [Bryobacteraceae bacterium]
MDFLKDVLGTTSERAIYREEKDSLWRAQIGYDWAEVKADEHLYECRVPLENGRMKPRTSGAREGRVNAKGIPVLYCATQSDTALSEVRPWIGAYISMAKMILRRRVKLVDCTVNRLLPIPAECDAFSNVWLDINGAFAEPVTPDDESAHYAPTQVLAEHFRHEGFDGIMYDSRLGSGKSIALFHIDDAEVESTTLHLVTKLKFDFEDQPVEGTIVSRWG